MATSTTKDGAEIFLPPTPPDWTEPFPPFHIAATLWLANYYLAHGSSWFAAPSTASARLVPRMISRMNAEKFTT